MESNLNPKESFAIIEAVINERKRRYEENGIFLIFWGAFGCNNRCGTVSDAEV